jgi:hypothetical protein
MDGKTKQLKELAYQIEIKREALGFTKKGWCDRFGQLGSTKTYGRIINPKDELEELDVERQLDNYLAAWEMIQRLQG